MDNKVKEREYKQFKALIWIGVVVYPFWLAYGVWSENYDAPIIVGFITGWAIWYIKHIKSKVEQQYTEATPIDGYSIPVDKFINIPVLIVSLAGTTFGCLCLLIAIKVFNN